MANHISRARDPENSFASIWSCLRKFYLAGVDTKDAKVPGTFSKKHLTFLVEVHDFKFINLFLKFWIQVFENTLCQTSAISGVKYSVFYHNVFLCSQQAYHFDRQNCDENEVSEKDLARIYKEFTSTLQILYISESRALKYSKTPTWKAV